MVGPAAIGAHRRADAVGDGVAERDDGFGRRIRADLDGRDEGPDRQPACSRKGGGAACVARGDIPRLHRCGMAGAGVDLTRQVEADRKLGQGRQRHLHRIAEERRARTDHRRRLAIEGQDVIAAGLGRSCVSSKGDVRRADVDRRGPELIGEADAHLPAAAAEADDLADRLVVKGGRARERAVGGARRQRRCPPAPGPVQVGGLGAQGGHEPEDGERRDPKAVHRRSPFRWGRHAPAALVLKASMIRRCRSSTRVAMSGWVRA